MKRVITIIGVIALLLTVSLPAGIIGAKSEDGLFFKVKGDWNSAVLGQAKLTLTANSSDDILTLKARWDEEVWFPDLGEGFPEAQWITGMNQEGPLGVWELSEDSSAITIYTEPAQVSLEPSGDIVGIEPGKVMQGTIVDGYITLTILDEPEISTLTGKIKDKVLINGIETFSMGDGPYAICFDGAYVWVTHPYELPVPQPSTMVKKIDISDGTVVDTVYVGSGAYNICFGGAYIWTANYWDNTVSKIDAVTNTVVNTINVGDGPYGVCYVDGYLWVANYGGNTLGYQNTVQKIDASDDTIDATIPVNSGPYAICNSDEYVWVTVIYNTNRISKIDISDDSVVNFDTVGNNPYVICYVDGYIWTADRFLNNVTKIDAETNAIIGTYPVGDGPYGICSGDGYIWVSNQDADTVSKIDIDTGDLINTIPVGNHPSGICYDGTSVWVVNLLDDNVSKILD
jgi:YVTN family beta-propeller protein